MQAEVEGAAGEDQHAEGAAAAGRRRRGGAQRGDRVRVAEAEEEQDALLPRHRPQRLVRHRGHGVRLRPPDEAPHRRQEQGAPHLDHDLRYLHQGPRFRQNYLRYPHRNLQIFSGGRLRGGGGEEVIAFRFNKSAFKSMCCSTNLLVFLFYFSYWFA